MFFFHKTKKTHTHQQKSYSEFNKKSKKNSLLLSFWFFFLSNKKKRNTKQKITHFKHKLIGSFSSPVVRTRRNFCSQAIIIEKKTIWFNEIGNLIASIQSMFSSLFNVTDASNLAGTQTDTCLFHVALSIFKFGLWLVSSYKHFHFNRIFNQFVFEKFWNFGAKAEVEQNVNRKIEWQFTLIFFIFLKFWNFNVHSKTTTNELWNGWKS